jgi:3-ketoacyl-CoA synthase
MSLLWAPSLPFSTPDLGLSSFFDTKPVLSSCQSNNISTFFGTILKMDPAPKAVLDVPLAMYFVIALLAIVGVILVSVWYLTRKPSVYCVDSALFVPPEDWQRSHEELLTFLRAQQTYNEESYTFLKKTLERSGTGDSTHWPPASFPSLDGVTPATMDMANTQVECEAIVFPIVQEIFDKTGVSARDIDFLVVNCSLYAPTPSLAAQICHKFGLRHDVRSYNLGGMGCSANVIAVDLAKQLLQNEPGTRALVVSTEMITPNLYLGNEKSMLLQNTLFRCGGVALLLSSRGRDASRSKYKLLHTHRTQISDDVSFGAVTQKEDSQGYRGVALSKQIVDVAGRAMTKNLTHMATKVLPISELAKAGLNRAAVLIVKKARKAGLTQMSVPQAYTPNFAKGIDHFCIHAGGRAVIDGVQKGLGLEDNQMRPSTKTLEDWGNTSSSSIWYEAEWIERFADLRRGHRVMQIAFGSGFKCNTAVWLTLKVDEKKRGVPLKPSKSEGQVLLGRETEAALK